MYGSFLYNCWAALIGFTIYFVIALQGEFVRPVPVLIGAVVTALILFILTYAVRYLLGYVLYTPEEIKIFQEDEPIEKAAEHVGELPSLDKPSTTEFEDETSEEIAQVVRTMMHQEQETVANS